MSRVPSSMITQADLFVRACAALDAGRLDNLAGLALEGRSRRPTEAEAATWSAVVSVASGHLASAQEAVQQAMELEPTNEAIRHVRISIMRRVATKRVEEQKALARERRSMFGRLRRD